MKPTTRRAARYFAFGSNLDAQDWTRWCVQKGFDPSCIRAVGRALLHQIDRPLEWLMGDGAYDAEGARKSLRNHSPGARYIAPPRKGAALGPTACTAPTQRDSDVQMIQARGRMQWQKRSGYNRRSRIEAELSRFKRVIGDGLRSRHDENVEGSV